MSQVRANAKMKRCSYCGAKNKASFEYCVRCSESLNGVVAGAPAESRRSAAGTVLLGGALAIIALVGVAFVTGFSSEAPAEVAASSRPAANVAPPAARRAAPILEGVDSKEVLDVYNQAMRAYNAEDYDTAIEGFASVVDALPDNPAVGQYLGLSYYHNGEFGRAVDALADARVLRPDSFALLDDYVTACKHNDDVPLAVEALSDFVDAHPEELEARLELARLARLTGDEALAMAQTEYLATENDLDPEFVYEYAVSLKEAGRIDEAKSVLENSIELDPESAVAHHAMGVIGMETNDVRLAASAFEEAVVREPDNGDFRFSLAQAYEKLDRIPESLDAYEAYLARAREDDERAVIVRRQLELAKQALLEEQARTSQGS